MTCLTRAVILSAVVGPSVGCRTVAIDPLAIQDAQLAVRVKTALVNDAELGATTIAVIVTRGVARLSGTVRTPAHVDRAVAVAHSVQGVLDVESGLRIGVVDVPPAEPAPARELESNDPFDEPDDPRLLAVGASFGWSRPRDDPFQSRASVGPLVRLGSGRGFGPTLGLNWFQTSLPGRSPDEDVISRIRIRPIMAGISYTFASDRVSVSPSLVGGIAFNSLSVPETGAVSRLAVEVDNSLVWQPSVSVWFDVSRRTAVNVSFGYVVTHLRVTVLEGGQLIKYGVPGDTAIIHAGIAYKLF